jgi:hypothetical protein
LSPLLFVVVMEALSRLLSAMMESRVVSGYFVGSRNQEEMIVSHLLFIDDTLLFFFVSLVSNNFET